MGWNRPKLTIVMILAWADDHYLRTGEWPRVASGWVHGVGGGQTWANINYALWSGRRGLPGRDSLARLLIRERGAYNRIIRPPLAVEQILAWADAHHERTGDWPGVLSGPIPEAPGENWRAISDALHHGNRGLPGGDSLRRLLTRHGRRRGWKQTALACG
jgi:hypothetical protein